MAENVQQSVETPFGLDVFGSLVTEMAPTDLPIGVSPDNQDVIYLPGSVASRPGLHKIFEALTGRTITYIRTFVQRDNTPKTLVLDSSGRIWVEDVFNNPITLTQIGQVSPGSYCNSVSAFGREYMVFHDGTHGTDSPRQFDGTNFDRITQDGPGGTPILASSLEEATTVQNSGAGAVIAITSITTTDPVTVET